MPPPALVALFRSRLEAVTDALDYRDPKLIEGVAYRLLLAFQRRAGEADAKAIAKTYAGVLGDMPPWAVAEAAGRYARRQVPGHNPSFPPSTAELAEAARKILEPFQLEAANLRAVVEMKPLPPPDPAERERITKGFDDLKKVLRSAVKPLGESDEKRERDEGMSVLRAGGDVDAGAASGAADVAEGGAGGGGGPGGDGRL